MKTQTSLKFRARPAAARGPALLLCLIVALAAGLAPHAAAQATAEELPQVLSADDIRVVDLSELTALEERLKARSDSVRRLIKSVVVGLAGEIHECTGGAEALAAYTWHRPDFVLMDIQMKLMDGITATRQIKAADPAARIIIVSDYDQAELREAARQAGACAYVVKQNLLELVRFLQEQSPILGLC